MNAGFMRRSPEFIPVLFTNDIAKSRQFYEEVLGLHVRDNHCNFRVHHSGGVFDVISTDDPGLTNGAVILYFEDVEYFRSRICDLNMTLLESFDGEAAYPKFEIKDPDLNTLFCNLISSNHNF